MSKRTSNAKKTVASTIQHAIEANEPSERVNAPVTDVTDGNGGRKVEPIHLNKDQQKAFDALTTTSARIRFLHAEKFSRGQIAQFLNKKYQHVRNVLITPLKKTDNTTNTNINTNTANH